MIDVDQVVTLFSCPLHWWRIRVWESTAAGRLVWLCCWFLWIWVLLPRCSIWTDVYWVLFSLLFFLPYPCFLMSCMVWFGLLCLVLLCFAWFDVDVSWFCDRSSIGLLNSSEVLRGNPWPFSFPFFWRSSIGLLTSSLSNGVTLWPLVLHLFFHIVS